MLTNTIFDFEKWLSNEYVFQMPSFTVMIILLLVAKVEHKYKCETWKWILEWHILLYASQSCRYIKPVLSVGRDAVLHFSLDLLYVYKIFGVYKKRQIFLCSALVCSVFCTFKGKISLWSCLLCSAMVKGPLITDGRNSSKRTGHYVDWSRTLQKVKISEQNFRKILSNGYVIS